MPAYRILPVNIATDAATLRSRGVYEYAESTNYCIPAYGWGDPTDVRLYKMWIAPGGSRYGTFDWMESATGMIIGSRFRSASDPLPTWLDEHVVAGQTGQSGSVQRPIYPCGQRPGGYPDGTTGLPPGATTWAAAAPSTQPPPTTQPPPSTGSTLQQQLDACNLAKLQIQQQLDTCMAQNSQLQGQRDSALGQVDTLTARIAQLEAELAGVTRQRDDLQQQLDALQASYDQCLAREQDLLARLAAATQGSGDMQGLVNELRGQIDLLNQQLADSNARIQELMQQLAEAAAGNGQMQGLLDQLAACQGDLAALQAAYDGLLSQGAGASDAELQHQLDDCRAALAALQVTADDRQNLIDGLQAEIATLRAAVGDASDAETVHRLESRIILLTRQLTLCRENLKFLARKVRGAWDPLAIYLGTGAAVAGAVTLWFGFGPDRRRQAA